MKIENVLNLINENVVIDFGHFHFDSAASFLTHYYDEDEEIELDTWGEEALEKCKKDKDFIGYDEAKALYDKLSNGDKRFFKIGKYNDSPKLVFRLGKRDNGKLVGFIETYYKPAIKRKSDSEVDELIKDIENRTNTFNGKEGFISIAIDPEYRGRGLAKTLFNNAVEKAKQVGFDAVSHRTAFKNRKIINFIQSLSDKFKPEADDDEKNVTFRYKFEKEEDEMTTSILSAAPQGGALNCGDNYVPGDMRTPTIFGKVQKRKKDEDTESIIPKEFYRYMSMDEISDILSYGAFRNLIDHEDDSEGRVKNPAGNLPYFKSFTYKLTKNGLLDFMGDGHAICVFDGPAMVKLAKTNKCKFLEYVFDNAPGSIHEYEYRLYSKTDNVPVDLSTVLKKVIFCKNSGIFKENDIENMLLDFSYNNINVPVVYIANPLTDKGKKFVYSLDKDENLQKIAIK